MQAFWSFEMISVLCGGGMNSSEYRLRDFCNAVHHSCLDTKNSIAQQLEEPLNRVNGRLEATLYGRNNAMNQKFRFCEKAGLVV